MSPEFITAKTDGADVTTYDYSSRGELMGVSLPDGTSVEYLHDPLGRRIAKKVNGAVIEKYLWSGLTTLLAVYDGSDNLLMRFEYADSRMPFAVMKEGVLYYPAYDQVGSLKAVADAAGNAVKRVEYDSFGSITADSDALFEIPFGFAGGLHDRDTGLVRFGYRDYDPETGRWTAKDPIGFAGGDSDLFGYCQNDPVNWVDPLGFVRWHGNCGGPNWTAGQTQSWNDFSQAEKNIIMEAVRNRDVQNGAPVDEQDELYMHHDMSYGDCRDNCANTPDPSVCEVRGFNDADYTLAHDLQRLGYQRPTWLKVWITIPVFYLQPGFRNRGEDQDGNYYLFRREF